MILLLLVSLLVGLYLLFVLPTQWLKIERVRYPLGLNCKILQISDIHVERLRISPEKLAEVIARESPDYIFLTGDFTKRDAYLRRLERYFAVFRDSSRPIYAVLGNHDYRLSSLDTLLAIMRRHGVTLLKNESVSTGDFQLIGIDDYGTHHDDIAASFRRVDDRRPRLVISHDPNVVLAIDRPFDYMMGGHFHGKQFNLPFLYNLKPMGELPKRGIYKGLHRTPWGTYYISKGIGQTGFNIRLFVRSEITVHYV